MILLSIKENIIYSQIIIQLLVVYMKLQLKSPIKLYVYFLFLLTIVSCKKETVYEEIDAFSNLQAKTEMIEGQYIINFQLAPFDYKQVTVRVSNNLSDFSSNPLGGQVYTVVINSNYACKVFLDPISNAGKYFYQIMVFDDQGNKVISDVFSFTTL